MLQLRLGMPIAGGEAVTECKCGAHADASFKNARHWMTVCKNSWRTVCHNKARDVIAGMYKSIKIPVEIEVGGRYSHINSQGESRPADILPSATAMGCDKEQALDVAFTDPTAASAIRQGSDTIPLKAAQLRHERKLYDFRQMMTEAARAGAPIEKVPLVMETTGAFSKEMQVWWRGMVKLEQEQRADGAPMSLRDQGLEHTWSANDWSAFQLQKLSFTTFRMLAEAIIKKINQNLPEHEWLTTQR